MSSGRAGTSARIFKINDSRGIVPEELDDETIYRIGYNLPRLLNARSVLSDGARPYKIHTKRYRRALCGGKVYKIDGLRLDFPDWWFIIRESNTEPVLPL